ncbi:TetR/AcrR family transcriptional regulator [Streptomyces sp. CA2R106]|uniref:TetR/AcrR family transcriptional regulator n=1 Tax=Streptomyces sp. CA2R106 TaxID=3120153 RepID=UPI0030083232
MKKEGTPATGAPATLWDRTRQLASQEILETALRLFTEQGYDETTIAQIAREAGVSQRTLFRYFGTKEDLLGGGGQERFGQVLTAAVGAQPADADAWEVLRAGIAALLALHDSREQALRRFRLLHNTASLRAGWLEKGLRFQEDLLPLIEPRMGAGNKGAKARAVIATAFACLDAASMAWVADDGRGDIIDLYDECLTAVRT